MRTERLVQSELATRHVNGLEDSMVPEAFVPLVMLPAQYNDLTRRSAHLEGERRLMVAVLEAAILDFLQNAHQKTPEERMRFAEVSFWIHRPKSDLFSFRWLCDALEIDADRLRRALDSIRLHSNAPRVYALGCAS